MGHFPPFFFFMNVNHIEKSLTTAQRSILRSKQKLKRLNPTTLQKINPKQKEHQIYIKKALKDKVTSLQSKRNSSIEIPQKVGKIGTKEATGTLTSYAKAPEKEDFPFASSVPFFPDHRQKRELLHGCGGSPIVSKKKTL